MNLSCKYVDRVYILMHIRLYVYYRTYIFYQWVNDIFMKMKNFVHFSFIRRCQIDKSLNGKKYRKISVGRSA